MNILVNPHNEQEEKVLVAFLDSLHYDYKSDIGEDFQVSEAFLDQYNKEIDEAEAEIESGNYVSHEEVEKLFASRRQNLNGDKME
jgi:hypothetical protein